MVEQELQSFTKTSNVLQVDKEQLNQVLSSPPEISPKCLICPRICCVRARAQRPLFCSFTPEQNCFSFFVVNTKEFGNDCCL
jgi:hypothetical protein